MFAHDKTNILVEHPGSSKIGAIYKTKSSGFIRFFFLNWANHPYR
jgi:hypothetical protein